LRLGFHQMQRPSNPSSPGSPSSGRPTSTEKEDTTTKPRTAAPNDLMLLIEPKVPGCIEDEEWAEVLRGPTQEGARSNAYLPCLPCPAAMARASGRWSPLPAPVPLAQTSAGHHRHKLCVGRG
jgi:hypothetical protein